jgi:hypothetical protein
LKVPSSLQAVSEFQGLNRLTAADKKKVESFLKKEIQKNKKKRKERNNEQEEQVTQSSIFSFSQIKDSLVCVI